MPFTVFSWKPRRMEDARPVRVLACFDKFKGSLDAESVGAAVLAGLQAKYPDKVAGSVLAMSDGGDGFLLAMKLPLQLDMVSVSVTGPCGTPVVAEYGRSKKVGFEAVAVVEMAAASGLSLVLASQRNPLHTTSGGTGELIQHAYDHGARRIIVGIGGSATNDGGIGCLQALGLQVTEDGTEKGDYICGGQLKSIQSLRMKEGGLLSGAVVDIACDVDNPFVGPEGATHVYSKQKGADTEEIRKELEEGMLHLVPLFKSLPRHMDVADLPGAGAAGGIAGGLIAALDAKLVKGVELVAEALGLEDAIRNADLVLTGEGRYDAQTLHGKVVSEVQKLSAKLGKPVVVICGEKKDIPPEMDNQVYDLLSMFDIHTSMTETATCLHALVQAKSSLFPVLGD